MCPWRAVFSFSRIDDAEIGAFTSRGPSQGTKRVLQDGAQAWRRPLSLRTCSDPTCAVHGTRRAVRRPSAHRALGRDEIRCREATPWLIARSLAPRGAAPVTPTAASKVLDERRGVWQRTRVAPSDSDA